MRAHTVSGRRTPGPGSGCSLSTGSGEGRRGDDNVCHPPLPDPRPSQASHSPLARSGDVEETVLESKALVYFFFRSWEQRGQNLQRKVGEVVSEGEDALCHSAQGSPAPPQRSLTISPEAWWSAPHRQSGTTQWSTGKGRRWRSRGQGAGWGQGKKRTPPPESPQEHSLIPSCGRILEGSKANHLQLPSSCPEVPLFSPYPLLVPNSLPVPQSPPP